MTQSPFIVMVLQACALLCAADARAAPRGAALPPEPQTLEVEEAKRMQKAEDMAAWLPRLVGRFDIQGVVEFIDQSKAAGQSPSGDGGGGGSGDGGGSIGGSPEVEFPNVRPVKGTVDCIAIGDGAGVQCVIHATWDEEWWPSGSPVEGGVSFLGPAAILFGFNPNAPEIRYLLLNTNGIAESETGTLNGDTARLLFEFHCESNRRLCRRVMGIHAAPEAKHITMTIDIEPFFEGTWGDPMTRISFDMRRVQQEAGSPQRLSSWMRMARDRLRQQAQGVQ